MIATSFSIFLPFISVSFEDHQENRGEKSANIVQPANQRHTQNPKPHTNIHWDPQRPTNTNRENWRPGDEKKLLKVMNPTKLKYQTINLNLLLQNDSENLCFKSAVTCS